MTLRELYREFVVAKLKAEEQTDRDIAQAWLINSLRRYKKLPGLKTLLDKRKHAAPQGQKQTVKQQLTTLQVLSEMYGIPLRKVRLRRKESKDGERDRRRPTGNPQR